jgi:GNAT superfamily N-acetyltransferase
MRLVEFTEQLPALINKTADVDGIQVSINTNDKNATVYASSNGRRLGYAEFDRDGNVLVPYDLAVDDKYRGQGIAAVMYDYVKSLGFTVKASADQTDDGKYFWKKNRGNERVWETELDEIARIPQGDFGTAGTIVTPGAEFERKELPGGSGLTYGVNKENDLLEIMIFDGDKLAGELDIVYTRGATKTWSVDSVAVEPAHRGQGIAKALYGIALSILKLPLEAGQLQTKHGQAMWLMLNSIPGVEVVGYDQVPTQLYQAKPGDQIVFQNKRHTGFTFPVRPGKNSMRSGRQGTGIYTSPSTTMIAKWTGQ